MNRLILIPACVLPFLSACDKNGAVGDKMDEIKAARKESTQGLAVLDKKEDVKSQNQADPSVKDIGEADFQTFISQPGKLNVVDFHADWCGPCKQLNPLLTGAIEAHAGKARLGRINVDNARELATRRKVTSIPDVRFFIDGKLVDRFVGVQSKESIEALIAKHSANIGRAEALVDAGSADLPATGSPTAASPAQPNPESTKPVEEKIKPMEKDWLPPGMQRK